MELNSWAVDFWWQAFGKYRHRRLTFFQFGPQIASKHCEIASLYAREGKKILMYTKFLCWLMHLIWGRKWKLVSVMNVIKQSNWKFWVAVEMATLKAADLILVCSIEKASFLAFQKFRALLSFIMSFLSVWALLNTFAQASVWKNKLLPSWVCNSCRCCKTYHIILA